MAEVIAFTPQPTFSFVLDAKLINHQWHVEVSEHSRWGIEPYIAIREVACALIPISAGLITSAEGDDPSTRGQIIAAFSIYEDGTADLHTMCEMNAEEKAWLLNCIERVTQKVKEL